MAKAEPALSFTSEQPWGKVQIGTHSLEASMGVYNMGMDNININDVIAVSHVWGDANCSIINIQNITHDVRVSSAEKMQKLISASAILKHEFFWLDNVCINQTDNADKIAEITRMKTVYLSSKAVLILLQNTKSYLLQELISIVLKFNDVVVPDIENVLNEEEVIKLIVLLAVFGKDEWYDRLWTVQESTLANSIYMVPADCNTVYDVSCLKNRPLFWLGVIKHLYTKLRDEDASEIYKNVFKVCYRWLPNKSTSLIDALVTTQGKKCTDKRDRIYGILGLIDGTHLIPAYGHTTVDDIATMVTEDSVNVLKQMDLLHIRNGNVVPSWTSLKAPSPVSGRIFHTGNCKYIKSIGLIIQNAHIINAEIIGPLDKRHMSTFHSCMKELKSILNNSNSDLVELVKGIMTHIDSIGYWDKQAAIAMWSILDSITKGKKPEEVLGETLSDVWPSCKQVIEEIVGDETKYILCTKDRKYMSILESNVSLPKNVIIIDYDGFIVPQFSELQRETKDERIPLIVVDANNKNCRKFISTVIQHINIRTETKGESVDSFTIT